MIAKVCKIQKVLNFVHFNQINTYISACKSVQIYKTATVTVHICTVTVHVQMIFFFSLPLHLICTVTVHVQMIFFFSLPLHLALPLCLLLTIKSQNHPCPQPQPPISIFFQQQNHKTTPAQPQPQIKVVPPKYKNPKIKISNNPS